MPYLQILTRLILTPMPRGSHLYNHSLFADEELEPGKLGGCGSEQPSSRVRPHALLSPLKNGPKRNGLQFPQWLSIFQGEMEERR